MVIIFSQMAWWNIYNLAWWYLHKISGRCRASGKLGLIFLLIKMKTYTETHLRPISTRWFLYGSRYMFYIYCDPYLELPQWDGSIWVTIYFLHILWPLLEYVSQYLIYGTYGNMNRSLNYQFTTATLSYLQHYILVHVMIHLIFRNGFVMEIYNY